MRTPPPARRSLRWWFVRFLDAVAPLSLSPSERRAANRSAEEVVE